MNWQTDSSQTEDSAPAVSGRELTIAELGTLTGLSARTLRYYEELGLLPGVRRRAGGRRVYAGDEIERLRFIQRLKTLGLSLGEIKQLNAVYAIRGSTSAMLEKLGTLLDLHLADLDGRICELSDLREEMERYRQHVSRRVHTLEQDGATHDPGTTPRETRGNHEEGETI